MSEQAFIPPHDRFALILAGGSGTRFWPLSRNAKPKQLLSLHKDGTLLNQTIDRLEGLIPKENILILTNALQEESVRELATTLPDENIFAEPGKRDTAPAVALGAALIASRNPDATMVVLPSDQLIPDTKAFQSVINDSLLVAANNNALITLGIKPTWACPSYGYIEISEPADISSDTELTHIPHEVVRFREKPNSELAESFLKQGNFLWNAGIFIWSVKTLTYELTQHTSELADFIEKTSRANDITRYINENFLDLTPISIDYALLEKATRVLNIEASFEWDDLGSWISLAKYLETQGDNNKTNTQLAEIDSENNIVFNDRKDSKVALLGVDDLIIVQTDDALLIANRHQADAIKELGKQLPEHLL